MEIPLTTPTPLMKIIRAGDAERFFTDVLWPDFSADDLHDAFRIFARRERRFGLTGEQVRMDGVQ